MLHRLYNLKVKKIMLSPENTFFLSPLRELFDDSGYGTKMASLPGEYEPGL